MPAGRRAAIVAVTALAAGTAFALSVTPSSAQPVRATAAGAASAVTARAAVPKTATPIANPLSFTDDFDNGRSSGWSALDEGTTNGPSRWQVVGGRLEQASNIWGGSSAASDVTKPGSEMLAGNSAWSNYDVSMTLTSNDDDDMGVIFRYVDRNDYYRFSMDSQRGYERLVKKVGGTYTVLAANTTAYVPKATYTVRIVAIGSSLEVYVDDAEVFSVVDSALTHGKFGPYTWGDVQTFVDDVSASVEDDDYFSIAVVPDIQNETTGHPDMLVSQMTWLAEQRANENLAAVLQEGDVVNDLPSNTQWANAHTGFSLLDGKVPLVVAAGNHDTEDYPDAVYPYTTVSTEFDQFIAGLPHYAVSGTFQPNDYLNTYQLLDAGGLHLLIMNLQFGAPDPVLTWAGGIVDEYPDRHAILLTHDYLGQDNQVRGTNPADANLPTSYNPGLNNGIDIWQKFVNTHPTVQFTFNGHVVTPNNASVPWSVGRLVAPDAAGNAVYQMLANYQQLAPGGQAYFRMIKFYPAQQKVVVTTYSPYEHKHLSDPLNQFTYTGVDLSAW